MQFYGLCFSSSCAELDIVSIFPYNTCTYNSVAIDVICCSE